MVGEKRMVSLLRSNFYLFDDEDELSCCKILEMQAVSHILFSDFLDGYSGSQGTPCYYSECTLYIFPSCNGYLLLYSVGI